MPENFRKRKGAIFRENEIISSAISCNGIYDANSFICRHHRGESIVTLGENLSEQQKQDLLKEMKAPKDATIITVSNAEEHKFLEGIVPKAQIGTRAISSSMITYTKPGSGLIVRSKNINWVTDAMYTNALITAGVKDAEIQITAPFKVSGTAALTGLMKAYETASNKQIPEEVKK